MSFSSHNTWNYSFESHEVNSLRDFKILKLDNSRFAGIGMKRIFKADLAPHPTHQGFTGLASYYNN